MSIYKIRIATRDCSKYDIVNAYSLKIVPIPYNLDPIANKLCNQDIFKINNLGVDILHSSVRSMNGIPGILVLNNSKTYGKVYEKIFYINVFQMTDDYLYS